MTGAAILSRIDQAYLKVDSTTSVASFRRAVESALHHGFRSLCLPPVLAGTAKKNFPALRIAAVVAYPLGLESLAQKEATIRELVNQGVDEVDVVYDLFALVNGNWAKLEQEALTLGKLTSRSQIFQKAIIETPILSEDHLRRAVEILKDSPVDCIKMEETHTMRTIVRWGRSLPMRVCEECGYSFAPTFQLMHFAKQTGKSLDDFRVCRDCR